MCAKLNNLVMCFSWSIHTTMIINFNLKFKHQSSSDLAKNVCPLELWTYLFCFLHTNYLWGFTIICSIYYAAVDAASSNCDNWKSVCLLLQLVSVIYLHYIFRAKMLWAKDMYQSSVKSHNKSTWGGMVENCELSCLSCWSSFVLPKWLLGLSFVAWNFLVLRLSL